MNNQDVSNLEVRDERSVVMTTKDWLITMLVFCIPVVGLVMLFVWAFSSDTNLNKRSYCRAQLIFLAIVTVLYGLFFFGFFVLAIMMGI